MIQVFTYSGCEGITNPNLMGLQIPAEEMMFDEHVLDPFLQGSVGILGLLGDFPVSGELE